MFGGADSKSSEPVALSGPELGDDGTEKDDRDSFPNRKSQLYIAASPAQAAFDQHDASLW